MIIENIKVARSTNVYGNVEHIGDINEIEKILGFFFDSLYRHPLHHQKLPGQMRILSTLSTFTKTLASHRGCHYYARWRRFHVGGKVVRRRKEEHKKSISAQGRSSSIVVLCRSRTVWRLSDASGVFLLLPHSSPALLFPPRRRSLPPADTCTAICLRASPVYHAGEADLYSALCLHRGCGASNCSPSCPCLLGSCLGKCRLSKALPPTSPSFVCSFIITRKNLNDM